MLLLSLTGILLIELNKRTFILYLSTLELIIYKYYIYIYGFLNAQSRSEPSCYFHIKKQTSLDYNIFKVK